MTGFLIGLLAAVSAPAQAQAGAERWTVQRDAQQCALSRPSSGPKPITLAVMLTPGTDEVQLLVIGRAIGVRELRVASELKFIVEPQQAQLAGRALPHRVVAGNGVMLAGLREDIMPRLEAASRLHVRLREKPLADILLPDVRAALQALKRCEDEALAAWGIDLAARARLRQPAKPLQRLVSYVNDTDYPDRALRANETGNSVARLTVGADGRVTACVTVASSGSKSLDEATCSVFSKRARFSPAIGSDGRPTADAHIGRLRWRLYN